MGNGSMWGALLWFAAIVAAIPAVLWLLKRGPMAGAGAGGPGGVRVLGQTALSAQQRLVTVEVGQGDDRLWLVLGVTPHGIRTLHTMAPAAPAGPDAAPPPPAAAFAQLLGRLRDGSGSGDAR